MPPACEGLKRLDQRRHGTTGETPRAARQSAWRTALEPQKNAVLPHAVDFGKKLLVFHLWMNLKGWFWLNSSYLRFLDVVVQEERRVQLVWPSLVSWEIPTFGIRVSGSQTLSWTMTFSNLHTPSNGSTSHHHVVLGMKKMHHGEIHIHRILGICMHLFDLLQTSTWQSWIHGMQLLLALQSGLGLPERSHSHDPSRPNASGVARQRRRVPQPGHVPWRQTNHF